MTLIRSLKNNAMENKDNVQKNWRTRQQKDELIHLFQQCGKSRKQFCVDQKINYYTFGTWCEQKRKKKPNKLFSRFQYSRTTCIHCYSKSYFNLLFNFFSYSFRKIILNDELLIVDKNRTAQNNG